MIGSLILISIGLTALVCAMCALLYAQQKQALRLISLQQQTLAAMEISFNELSDKQLVMHKRIDQLATDVLQREIYKSAEDRHKSAIKSAKQGKNLFEIMQRHGLSTDEAALISSFHTPESDSKETVVKNANLIDPSTVDVL